jgi:ATP-dependent DNA ligase
LGNKKNKLTRDERLRQPVFLGLREDKEAKDVMLENPQAI